MYEGKKKKLKRKIILAVFLIFFAVIWLALYLNVRLRPVVREMATARSRTIATRVISEAIEETISDKGITYDDLVSFEKTQDGTISAVKTNIVKVNQLKSALSVNILNRLSETTEDELAIPIGSVVNSDLFSGRGFKIKIKIIPIGSVSTDITNSFASAGINQTLHRINMEVRAVISLIMPTLSTNVDIVNSVCIAETVIVGRVPSAYTEVIEQNDDMIGVLNDFQSRIDDVY
ncbi:MAG: sporulation protein YunB [Ruminococcaceae bacterium]|nr:sporulation protein YunB [Oscillospiraceae bacterium]